MPIDYSKWDNLELSDSEDERKPEVIKLDGTQQVELGKNGYKIISRDTKVTTTRDPTAVSKFWKQHVKNGNVVKGSHAFSQNRYEICLLIVVKAEGKPKFEVVVTDTRLRILRSGVEIFNREFYARVKDDDDYVNWKIVRQDVDWKALSAYCHSEGSNIVFTEFYEQTFIEVELTKYNKIEDCFIWWPKAFKVSF
ncbi:hypothetical protein BaOVIS_030960 [Babesia ovis]|uniref:CS domain-containing protein n=1 Tax=Babesia ovis TaxID=5869 RepID=A0A9W5WWK6_BABOV|nr:hypothetical protein BaOVIS_030960 [Babesia ovis]